MPARDADRGARPRPRVLAVIVLLVGLAAALPYLVGGVSRSFIPLDDQLYVSDNPRVGAGLTLEGARWALTTFYADNWHPLTWISHMTDVSLFGLDPRAHHAVNIGLHALAAGVFFLALVLMTGAPAPSALAALLFGAHPLQVESVAWVSQRKGVLSGLLFALVLLAYERYTRRRGAGSYLAALLALALGLAAKPMLVTVPFVLLLLDIWPLGRTRLARPAGDAERGTVPLAWLVLEKVPFFALSAGAAALTYLAQGSGGTVVSLAGLSPGVRSANALVAYALYLGKSVWPSSLGVFYPHPLTAPPLVQVVAALLLLSALSAAAVLTLRRRPAIAVGWLWFLGMLVPVIGLVQVGLQRMADRYVYLPIVGLLIAGAWSFPGAGGGLRRRGVALGAGAAVILLATSTAIQVGRWKNGETLFLHTLEVTTDNWLVQSTLANTLLEQGRPEEALPRYRETVRIMPGYAGGHFGLGNALFALDRMEEAAASFREALRIRPRHLMAHCNLGLLLNGLGRYREATPHLREALRISAGAEGYSGAPLPPVLKAVVQTSLERALVAQGLQNRLTPR